MERPGESTELQFDPSNSATWDAVLENLVGKGIQTQIFGAIAVLERPVSKRELRKLASDYGSDQQQDDVLRALALKGMIRENPDGTFQVGSAPEAQVLIKDVATGDGWKNTRWRVRKLILGTD